MEPMQYKNFSFLRIIIKHSFVRYVLISDVHLFFFFLSNLMKPPKAWKPRNAILGGFFKNFSGMSMWIFINIHKPLEDFWLLRITLLEPEYTADLSRTSWWLCFRDPWIKSKVKSDWEWEWCQGDGRDRSENF